ncbi:AraC family transcriptional regulator [Blastococcus sp. SYSU D00820]
MGPGRPRSGLAVRLDTDDVDSAREQVGRTYCPHSLTPRGPGFRARHAEGGGAGLGVYVLSYGRSPVRVRPTPFRDFVLLSRPVAGALEVGSGRRRTVVGTGDVVALDAREEHDLAFGPGCRLLTVKVPLADIARAAGAGGAAGIRTGVLADRTAWDGVTRFLLDEALPGGLLEGPVGRSVVGLVAAAALAATPPEADRGRSGGAGVVRRAQAFVHDHAQTPIGLVDIAAAAGVSPRTLQQHFRDRLGTTPAAYLRDVRLAGAHRDLLAGNAGGVAEVAWRWGFAHPGRFAADCRRAFGRLPSETARGR